MLGGPPPEPGFEEAFDRLFPRAVRLAGRIVGDAAAAEAVASESMARAYSQWSELAWEARLDGWVQRVATNLALDEARKRPPAATGTADEPAVDETTALLWADDDLPPLSRSRAELLDGIERRGLALRRRRRMARRSVAGSAVVAATIALMSVLPGRGSDRSDVSAAPGSATTSTTNSVVDSTVAATTSSVVPATTVALVPTVVEIVPTVPPTVAVTAPPTTEPPPEPQCGAAQLVATVSTDQAIYRPGERVRYTASVRNSSTDVCYRGGHSVTRGIRGPGDVAVGGWLNDATTAVGYLAFHPGEAMQSTGEWNQCIDAAPPCIQAPPGTYVAVGEWEFTGPSVRSAAPFTLVAG